MKNWLLAGMALLAALPAYAQDHDAPRKTGVDISTQQSLTDLQACLTRYYLKHGRVTPIPTQNGIALDFQFKSMALLAGPGKAPLTLTISELGGRRSISVEYRHPLSAKGALNLMKSGAKRCFPQEYEAWRASRKA